VAADLELEAHPASAEQNKIAATDNVDRFIMGKTSAELWIACANPVEVAIRVW
jgi:hypothetical protein